MTSVEVAETRKKTIFKQLHTYMPSSFAEKPTTYFGYQQKLPGVHISGLNSFILNPGWSQSSDGNKTVVLQWASRGLCVAMKSTLCMDCEKKSQSYDKISFIV